MVRKSVLCNESFSRMKRTFHIASPNSADTPSSVLLCEVSQHHVCIALADASTKSIEQLSYYEVKNGLEPDKLRQLIKAEGFELSNIRRMVLSNACKEMLLVPVHHFTEESAKRFYITTYGNTGELFFFDELTEEAAVLVHAVPQPIMSVLKTVPERETKHTYTCWLKALNDSIAEDGIAVHFTNKEVNIVAKREQQLKLAQTYFYTTPLDVLYYLLAVCREYGLSQTGTTLMLSGLISNDSAMYKELHQYFSHIAFWKPAGITVQSEHPHHFFSSMYNLAACAL